MDISKLFAKKRDLSDQFNNGDKARQIQEEISQAVALEIHLETFSKKFEIFSLHESSGKPFADYG